MSLWAIPLKVDTVAENQIYFLTQINVFMKAKVYAQKFIFITISPMSYNIACCHFSCNM